MFRENWLNQTLPLGMLRIIKVLLPIIIVFTCLELSANRKWEMYRIVDTVPIKKTSLKKVYKTALKWFEDEKATKLVRANPNQYILEGKGYFVYYNHIKMEDIFLSPRAAERMTGNVVFQIKISITDSLVVTEFFNFIHTAYYSPYGEISFGEITDYETTPPGKCMENKVWCNAVWSDLKEKSRAEVLARAGRLIPDIMIRREGKSFKPDREKDDGDTISKEVDPKDYLNIENYLIKEDED